MVCRKRSCYDTRNCFIDSLASRRHSSQFVTWPISIFQPDTEKNLPVPRNRRRSLTTPTRRPTDRPTDASSHPGPPAAAGGAAGPAPLPALPGPAVPPQRPRAPAKAAGPARPASGLRQRELQASAAAAGGRAGPGRAAEAGAGLRAFSAGLRRPQPRPRSARPPSGASRPALGPPGQPPTPAPGTLLVLPSREGLPGPSASGQDPSRGRTRDVGSARL